MSVSLSPRQRKLLVFIIEYIRENVYPPVYQEMADHMQTSTTAAFNLVLMLVRDGYIKKHKGMRGIQVLKLPPTLGPGYDPTEDVKNILGSITKQPTAEMREMLAESLLRIVERERNIL